MSQLVLDRELTALHEVVYKNLRGAVLLDAERYRSDYIVLWADGCRRAGTHRAVLAPTPNSILVYGNYFDGEHAIVRAVADFVDRAGLERKED